MGKSLETVYTYIKKNTFMAGTVVTGVIALAAISSVLAWTSGSAATGTSTTKPVVQSADKQSGEKPKEGDQQYTADGSVLGASTSVQDENNTPEVQTAVAESSAAPVVTGQVAVATPDQSTDSSSATPTPSPAPAPAPAPAGANLIANPSVEESANNLPNSWGQAYAVGNNTATYDYLPTGRTGSHSLKVTVSNYTDGDAKWITTAVPVTAGKTYTVSDYYKSDVASEVIAYNGQTGAFLAVIGSPAAASDWTAFSTQYAVPSGVTSVILGHAIYSNGSLTTDDYGLTDGTTATGVTTGGTTTTPPATGTTDPSTTPPATGNTFTRALVSLTFDDGWKSIHTNALPKLQSYGFLSTQYINSQPIEDAYDGYMIPQDIADFAAAGHEIAWHTRTHADLATLDQTAMNTELTVPDSFISTLMNLNVTMSKNFATPFGSYNDTVISAIKAAGWTSHRSTDVGFNAKADIDANHTKLNTDNIKVQNMVNTTTAAEVQGWVNDAIATKSWLVIVYHEVSDSPVDPDPTYSTTTANFDAQLNVIKQSGVTVKTVQAALDELKPQL